MNYNKNKSWLTNLNGSVKIRPDFIYKISIEKNFIAEKDENNKFNDDSIATNDLSIVIHTVRDEHIEIYRNEEDKVNYTLIEEMINEIENQVSCYMGGS